MVPSAQQHQLSLCFMQSSPLSQEAGAHPGGPGTGVRESARKTCCVSWQVFGLLWALVFSGLKKKPQGIRSDVLCKGSDSKYFGLWDHAVRIISVTTTQLGCSVQQQPWTTHHWGSWDASQQPFLRKSWGWIRSQVQSHGALPGLDALFLVPFSSERS